MQCKEQEEGGFDPFIITPNSSFTVWLQPWPKLLGQKDNSLSKLRIFPLPPPTQCSVGVIYIQVLFQQNQHSLGERETAEIGSYNNIDPSFLRGTM